MIGRLLLVCLVGLLAACRTHPSGLPLRRPTPQGSAVVSEHPLATQVGLEVLQRAEQDRRVAAHSLETGEATLAAYRRTLQQPQAPAGFFTQRG